MHLIGYWIRDLRDEEFCAPQEVVGDMAADCRAKIADYLDGGAIDVFNSQWGFSWCRFFCGIFPQQMGSKELTDGHWRWPEGLSHYVRAHAVTLPGEFIEHALANESYCRSHDDTWDPVAGDPSPHDCLEFWRKWCVAHRSPGFVERLRRARAEADARARVFEQQEIQRRILAEIARHGLGDDRCIFVGCHERVLSGMKLCARHVLREADDIASGCYAITPGILA